MLFIFYLQRREETKTNATPLRIIQFANVIPNASLLVDGKHAVLICGELGGDGNCGREEDTSLRPFSMTQLEVDSSIQ